MAGHKHTHRYNLTPKETRKRRPDKTQSQQKVGKIQIIAVINEIQTKDKIKKISVTKNWFFEKKKRIDKPLTKKERRLKNNIRNERGEITFIEI